MPINIKDLNDKFNNMENGVTHSPIVDDGVIGINNDKKPLIGDSIYKSVIKTDTNNNPITSKQYDKYAKYNVYLNNIDTQEELDRERAENQSNWEKAGRSLAQILEDEIILGTLKSVGDIVGAIQNIFKDERNFSNNYSKFFEDIIESNKERLEIYRQNPDKALDFGDFGWWADGFVTVGSTASLMIPSTGIAKGVSLIGKAANLEYKTAKLLSKIPSKVSKTGRLIRHPNLVTKELGNAVNATNAALISRTVENYQEAREVYRNSYDETLNTLNNFNENERQEFINRNQRFIGLDNKQIAEIIAGEGADKTMHNDYAMLLMDVLQYRALGSLMKGSLKGHSGAKARIAARNELKRLNGITDAARLESEQGFNLFKEYLTYNIKHPVEGIKSIPWSEAIEEGYQGIQSEKGQEYARMILDPSISARTLDSYLSDASIWEQAFWGVIGGVGFQGFGKAFNYAKEKIIEKKAKNQLTEDEASNYLSNNKKQLANVKSRTANMQQFAEALHYLNEGHLPEGRADRYEKDENGNIVTDSENAPVLKTLNEAQIESEKITALSEFMTNFVLDAVDSNTYDTLQDFINDENFKKFLVDNGMQEDAIDAYTKANANALMEDIYDKYINNLQVVFANVSNPNEFALKAAARDITRRDLGIQNLKIRLGEIENQLANSEDYNKIPDAEDFLERNRLVILNTLLNELDTQEKNVKQGLDNKALSKQAYDAFAKDIATARQNILSMLNNSENNIHLSEELKKNYKDLIGKLTNPETTLEEKNTNVLAVVRDLQTEIEKGILSDNEYQEPALSDNTKKLIRERIYNEVYLAEQEGLMPVTKEEYVELYKELNDGIDKFIEQRFNDAIDTVTNYLEKSEDLDKALEDIMTNNVQDKKLKDSLDILKLGYSGTQKAYLQILRAVGLIQQERDIKEQQQNEPIVDGKVQTGEKGKQIADEIRAKEEEPKDDTSTSTGEEQLTPEEQAVKDQALQLIEEEKRNTSEDTSAANIYGMLDREEVYLLETLNRYVTANRQNIRDLLLNIKSAVPSDKSYSELRDRFINTLLEVGADQVTATKFAVERILELFSMINHTNKKTDTTVFLAKQLASRIKLTPDKDLYSFTQIEDSEVNELVHNLLQSFINENNIPNINGQYHINLEDVFNYLLKNNEIDFQTARLVFMNMRSYIENNSDRNTIVINNTPKYNEYFNNPSQFIANLQQDKAVIKTLSEYSHSLISYDTAKKEIRQKIDSYFKDKSKHTVKAVRHMFNDDSGRYNISIQIDGVEIGFMAIPNVNIDGTTIYLEKSHGFNYYLTPNNETGEISSNFDELFDAIINGDKELLSALTSKKNDILNNPIIKKLIDDGYIVFNKETSRSDTSKTMMIKKTINDLINYSDAYVDQYDNIASRLRASFNQWKERLLDNYKLTLDIDKQLKDNKIVYIDINSYRIQTPNFKEQEHSIKEAFEGKNGLNPINNPLIAVSSNGKVLSEDGREFNDVPFPAGTMGFLLNTANGYPIIAPFSSANKFFTIDENGKRNYGNKLSLGYLIKKTIIDNLNAWNDDKISFDEVAHNFSELFGVFARNEELNPLTYGLKVIKIRGHGIGLVDTIHKTADGKDKLVAIVYNNEDNKKAISVFSDNTGNLLTYYDAEQNIEYGSFSFDENRLNFVVDHIMNHITANRSFYAMKHNSESDVKNNQYFYKENGKYVIKFTNPVDNRESTTLTYDTFGEMLIKNGMFNTYVHKLESAPRYTKVDTGRKGDGIYIKVQNVEEATEVSAITNKKQGIKPEFGIRVIESASETSPVEGRAILEQMGLDQETIDFLASPITDNLGNSATLIPDKVYYRSTQTDYDGLREANTGKVFITKRGIDSIRKRRDAGMELTRLLIHEQLHSNFANLTDFAKEARINEIIETYNQFIKHLKNNNKQTENWIFAKRFIEENNFTIDGLKLANNVGEKERRRLFAEEWIVESITRPELARVLNSIEYEGKVEEEKESLLQRIIKAILKIFGINLDNNNKNSILAKEYSLFGDKSDIELVSRSTNANGETKIEPIKEQEPIENEQETTNEDKEINYAELDDLADEFGIDMLSSTSTPDDNGEIGVERQLSLFDNNDAINPSGFKKISDMNEFVKQYPKSIRPTIRQMLVNGEIEYICR